MSASNGAVILPAGPAGLMLPGVVRPTPLDYIAVPDGLWAYWPFDTDTADPSNVYDLINGFNVSRSSLGGDSGLVPAQIDRGLSFNGTTNYLAVPTAASIAGASAFTFACWVNLTSLPAGSDATVYQEHTSLQGNARAALDITTTGFPYLRYRDAPNDPGGSGVNITSATALVAGRWYHVVLTYDSVKGFGAVYVNAALTGSGTPANALGTSVPSDINIGALISAGSPVNPFPGVVDDFRIYKRALSSAEIMQLYAAGIQGRRDAGQRLPAYADLSALFAPAVGSGAGSATGAATASGVGASKAAATGAATGTASVSGVGASKAAVTASATGTASVTAVGAATFAAAGSATGTASVTAVGVAAVAAAGSATGTASVSAVGASTFAAAGSAAGSAAVSAVGASTFAAVASATGSAAVSAVGASTFAAVASATGSAAVSGASATVTNAGSAGGSASVIGVGASIFSAVATATAVAAAGGIGPTINTNRFFQLF